MANAIRFNLKDRLMRWAAPIALAAVMGNPAMAAIPLIQDGIHTMRLAKNASFQTHEQFNALRRTSTAQAAVLNNTTVVDYLKSRINVEDDADREKFENSLDRLAQNAAYLESMGKAPADIEFLDTDEGTPHYSGIDDEYYIAEFNHRETGLSVTIPREILNGHAAELDELIGHELLHGIDDNERILQKKPDHANPHDIGKLSGDQIAHVLVQGEARALTRDLERIRNWREQNPGKTETFGFRENAYAAYVMMIDKNKHSMDETAAVKKAMHDFQYAMIVPGNGLDTNPDIQIWRDHYFNAAGKWAAANCEHGIDETKDPLKYISLTDNPQFNDEMVRRYGGEFSPSEMKCMNDAVKMAAPFNNGVFKSAVAEYGTLPADQRDFCAFQDIQDRIRANRRSSPETPAPVQNTGLLNTFKNAARQMGKTTPENLVLSVKLTDIKAGRK